MPLNRLTPAILLLSSACAMDYGYHEKDQSTRPEQADEVTEDDEPNEEFPSEDVDTGDTGEPDVEEPDEEDDLPSFSFRYVLDACLNLDEDDCLVNLEEGDVDATCISNGTTNRELIESNILEAARNSTGDSSLTLEDVKDGAAPAVVRATYAMHISGLSGEDTWAEYSSILINFGTDDTVFDDVFTPYDRLSVETVRCTADRRSFEIDLASDDASFAPLDAYNAYWPANEGSDGSLDVHDFRLYQTGSDTLKVFGVDYDSTDANFVTTPSESALDDASNEINDAAYTLVGGTGSTVISY
jgi:hypothetical protein